MGQLEDMTMFVRIVDAGGIGKAAEQLNIAKSAVSRRLSDLEKRLATQLLNRTTRKSNLTDAGHQYYQRSKSILEEVNQLNEQTSGDKARIDGTLKMTAPLSFGLMHLGEIIDEFSNQHDGLKFQIDFSDRHIDLIEEGYELAIRIGELQDSSYQAKRITSIQHVFCASSAYLKKHGSPENIQALSKHEFLHYGLNSNEGLIFKDSQGKQQRLEVNSKMNANNGDFLKAMAIKGHGITYLPSFLVYQELANGELTSVLTEFKPPQMYAYAIYPKSRFLSQRSRLLIDFLSERFGDIPYWDQMTD